jgi:hypothetical protein
MSRQKILLGLFLFIGAAWAGDVKDKSVSGKPARPEISVTTTNQAKPGFDLAKVPLSFEPNMGQSDSADRFVARSHAYNLKLQSTAATFQFYDKNKHTDSVKMDLENASHSAKITGESLLPGKADYFPKGDPSTWVTNVPTYSRVHYKDIYQGVDISFYGSASRLEYDFIVQAGADPNQVRMRMSGPDARLNDNGDLVMSQIHFLKPLAYQMAANGERRDVVLASYRLEKDKSGSSVVTFALGKYDHSRALVIDPVVDALGYSEYLNQYYVGAVTVDSAGNSYVTGTAYPTGAAFYVNKFSSTGVQTYTASFGTGNQGYPYAIAVDSSGQAYVAGQIYTSGSSVPATSTAYQMTPGTANPEAFMAVLSASGASLPYCTYLTGNDNQEANAVALAIDSSAKVYIGGNTYSASFPVTTGAYQTANPSNVQIGFVSKFDPTKSGTASLIYSTLLGSTTSAGQGQEVSRIAVDYAGNAYIASQGGPGFPVTASGFKYTGLQAANGGAYVTKINPTGTALVYSDYLGYGGASGIAIDTVTSGTPSAYVSGWIYGNGEDFPTTAGAYQVSYAGGFAVKLSGDGTTELYSTFLSGPSGFNTSAVDAYPTLAVPVGCASNCNAYITGRTNSSDWPTINPIQNTAPGGTGGTYSAFITELNSTGTGALFSTYFSGYNTVIYRTIDNQAYGITPAIAVDGSGNIFLAANATGSSSNSDLPATIAAPSGSSQAFLAKINASATAGFTLTQPTSVNFGNYAVGITSSINTVRLNNYGGTAVTGLSISATPASVFAESDSCSGTIAAGGSCSLNLTFTPNAPATRAGTLTITSSASNSPITVPLTGSGSDSGYTVPSVTSLTFASQNVGTSSAPQTFTVTNQGDVSTNLNIYTDAAQFVPLNNCPSQLAAGANCTVSVTFAPSQPGLYQKTLTIQTSSGPNFYVGLSGTGAVAGATTGLTPSQAALQFGPVASNTTSGAETFYVTNTGTEPVAIYSVVPSGPFNVTYVQYGTPFQLNPQQTFQVNVTFSPTTAGAANGSVAIASNATGSPLTIPITGTGIASTQSVEFYPSTSVSFPDTPQGTTSGNQTIYLENIGTAPMNVSRTVVSSGFTLTYSSCEANTLQGIIPNGYGGSSCQVNVEFTPSETATGSQTGTLTFYDSAANSPQVVNLMGNAITATGTIAVAPSQLTFGPQPQGLTTGVQYFYVQNPGNTPVTVTGTAFSGTNATDFTTTGSNCGGLPYTLAPLRSNCFFTVQFTPGGTGNRTATFTVSTSAGNSTGSLIGTGQAATQALELIPTSLNLGSVVDGQSGNYEGVYLYNVGTETVTFSANASITGTNAADFTQSNGCSNNGNTLAPGASCGLSVRFSPTTTAAESATLTFTDSAGTQTFALSGTGVATTPSYTTQYHAFDFPAQLVGTTSPTQYYTYFYNNTASSISLGNVAVTGSFLIPHGYDTCSGQTIGASSNCYVYVSSAPNAAGYFTGSLTFESAGGTPVSGAPVLPLTGYAVTPTYSAFVNPTTNRFTAFQVIGTTSGEATTYLYNTGNTAFSVGSVAGTDFGLAGANAEFSIYSANGGYDGCTNQTVQPGSYCQVNITFTPNAAGTRTGTITFPITYSNNSTTTITGNLTGTGTVEKNSAVLTPPNGAFVDQVAGITTNYNVTTYLNNNGNQPFNVGALTDTNSTEFSTSSSVGGYDSCSSTTIQPGNSCQINVRFTPSTTGARSAVLGFPVTFADHTTTTPTFSLTGNGVASAKTLTITPSSLKFGTEIQTQTTAAIGIGVSNTGNSPILLGTDSISTNSAEFAITYDSCRGTTLQYNQSCSINVTFTPGSSATGAQSGVLTIADNATGGPHTVPLTGIAITAAQQILVTPNTLAFGNQPAGSTSSSQIVYITNQGDSYITNTGITLGGTNAGDFGIVANQCGGSYNPHSSCYVTVQFNPPSNASGALSATISETDSGTPSSHSVSLTGTAVTPGPAATLNPATLVFTKQNVGSNSAAQNFSLTNTGSANLTISSAASTNATEFPIYSDGCSGTTLATGAHCIVSVQFAPTLGGTRTGSIKITDNASGSPQTVAVSGTGYGIPATSYTPASLSFSNTNINASSASQNITLKNTGTDTLNISGVSITGGTANQFSQTNTCPATLAPAASCAITVTFKPTSAGSLSAYITVADNANNIAGSTQSTPISGTGVAVPTGSASPTGLTFPSTNIGVNSSVMSSTLTNSGTGPLTLASIAIGGANAADYSQTNTCGSTLVAGANCVISVTFKPSAAGTRTATVTVTDNANNVANSTQTVTLSGTGTAVSTATLSPNSLTFTDQTVNTTSAAQTITLNNSGTGPLTITSIALSGTIRRAYAPPNNCNGSVATGGSCTISVTFKPLAPGSLMATLTVTDNANNGAGSQQTASLSGTGIGVPAASVSPSTLTFSTTTLGQTTASKSTTLSNTGTGPLAISSIALGGMNSNDFAETTTCGSTLAAGSNCSISVTFAPTAIGSRTATVVVTDNSGNAGATQTVTLNGVGAFASELGFVSVTPCRLVDTRGSTGSLGGPSLAAGSTRSFPLLSGSCGIPSTALAYSLNITVVPKGTLDYLSIWATGQPQPNSSTLNSLDGRVVANAAITASGASGAVSVYVTDLTDVIIDVNGYFAPTSSSTLTFVPVTPCRIVDTRQATGTFGGPALVANANRSFPVPTGSCSIPSTASAYSLNATALPATTLNYLTLYPTGTSQPTVSTLNSGNGQVTANAAIVPAGTSGAVTAFATNQTNFLMDINGYFTNTPTTPLVFNTVAPCRVVDTRTASSPLGGPVLAASSARSFPIASGSCGIPSNATAYAVNVTAMPTSTLTYLTLWPTGQSQPTVSTLNSYNGQVVANAALVPAGTSGAVSVYVSNQTNITIDIVGYFSAP